MPRMTKKIRYTLHNYITQGIPTEEEVAEIKRKAVEEFKTKVKWDKRTQRLIERLGTQAYVYNPDTKNFHLDIELAKEMAMLLSADLGNGQRFYLGF